MLCVGYLRHLAPVPCARGTKDRPGASMQDTRMRHIRRRRVSQDTRQTRSFPTPRMGCTHFAVSTDVHICRAISDERAMKAVSGKGFCTLEVELHFLPTLYSWSVVTCDLRCTTCMFVYTYVWQLYVYLCMHQCVFICLSVNEGVFLVCFWFLFWFVFARYWKSWKATTQR